MHAGDPHARPRTLRVFTAVTLLCRRRRGLVTEAAQNSSRGLPAEEAGPHLRSRLPASPRDPAMPNALANRRFCTVSRNWEEGSK